ncbi:MAG: hypothetical protein WB767_05140 [Nocardioides sp.]
MTLLRRLPVVVCTAALALTGCGGEPLPVDDGSVVSLDGTSLPDDTEVIDLDTPTSATAEQVVAALDSESIVAEARRRTEATGLSLDPVTVAGLVGTVSPAAKGRSKPFVVLVFDEPASALVFVASDRAVIDAPGTAAVDSFFSGNVVGYYAPTKAPTGRDAFSRALSSLADS